MLMHGFSNARSTLTAEKFEHPFMKFLDWPRIRDTSIHRAEKLKPNRLCASLSETLEKIQSSSGKTNTQYVEPSMIQKNQCLCIPPLQKKQNKTMHLITDSNIDYHVIPLSLYHFQIHMKDILTHLQTQRDSVLRSLIMSGHFIHLELLKLLYSL